MNIIKTKRFVLRLHPAGLALLGIVAATGHGRAALAALLALLIHEGFHLLAVWGLKAPLRQLELTPFGGVMDVESFQSLPRGRQVCIAAAGTLGSLLTGVLCRELPGEGGLLPEVGRMSLALGLFNALPALPMDGGQALAALGHGLAWDRALRKALMLSGVTLGLALVLLAFYGAWHGHLNLTLLMVGPYLAYAARQAYMTQRMRLVEESLNLRAKLGKGHAWKVEGVALPLGISRAELLRCVLSRHPRRLYYFFWVEPETGKIREVWEEKRMMEEVFK
ncbi:MAG: hypothetical protein VB099_08720 [Candidatus Limiplasma sp.]|nr:hypothetical protein [Candidatus Limiplasma sp.]